MPDKLLIAPGTDPDQFYATGLLLHDFITLQRGAKTLVAAGGFEYPQLKAAYPDAVRFEDLGKTFPEVVRAFCKKFGVRKPQMPSSTPQRYAKLVPGAVFVNELFPARRVKRENELRKLRDIQAINERAIVAVRDALADAKIKKGVAYLDGKILTSEQLKSFAAVELAKHDAACPEMIIASGKQGALPHHRGQGPIREGSVVVDIFPQHNQTRYFADCTRTFVVGDAPKTFAARYAALLDVHKRVGKALKHGVVNVDKLSRDILEEHGFKTDFTKGTGYVHGLGHGVGLEIHEWPRLKEKLVTGNVITIEPGLYYDYGIRIEDIGVVTKSGFANFTKLSKNPYLQ